MSHVRTQIRNAVVGLLDSLATTGDRAYSARLSPIAQDQLPALNIFVDDESIELQTIHDPAMLSRSVTIRIDCLSALADGLDDDLDQIALEVEDAIAADVTLGGLLNGAMIPGGIEVDRSGDGAVPIGRLTLVYQAQYEVLNNAADVAI
jgi:hypothetical protein